jgi:16S rRNA (adenine1518-N6/adenine1519-N6)-dimethyltransferase
MTSPHTLLNAWDLRARKEFGQNFLKDPAIAARIAEGAHIANTHTVLEIGAGLGVLTTAAARLAGKVLAVEKDRHLIPLLRAELLAQGLTNVEIIEHDILRLSLEQLVPPGSEPLIVLGNLPYNISSQVVVKMVEHRRLIRRAVLMFQKELAQRLCAGPGSRTYGRLSVLLQYCADLTLLRDIPASQFFPKPKVDSAVLRIDFKSAIAKAVADEKLFVRVIQAAFGQRRKTMRNALSGGLLPLDNQAATDLLTESGIDPQRRAETLSVNEFVTLTNNVAQFLAPPESDKK